MWVWPNRNSDGCVPVQILPEGPVIKSLSRRSICWQGIPSVVYGFFGMVVIVPVMSFLFGGSGKSMATASVLLGIMILPTIIGVSESAINAVPDSYYEGALALGSQP